METIELQNEKDRVLWRMAKKRVDFKNHLLSYLTVNVLLWCLWFITGKQTDDFFPWPLSVSLWWGFGLMWHFLGVYVFEGKFNQVEKEYQKLKERTSDENKF